MLKKVKKLFSKSSHKYHYYSIDNCIQKATKNSINVNLNSDQDYYLLEKKISGVKLHIV